MLRNARILHSSCLYTKKNVLKPQTIVTTKQYVRFTCCHSLNTNRDNSLERYNKIASKCSTNNKLLNNSCYYSKISNKLSNRYFNISTARYSTSSPHSDNDSDRNLKLENDSRASSVFENVPKIIDNCKCKIDPYMKLMRVDKPIGTWLLFWPGAWSILLASSPSVCPLTTTAHTLALFLVGAFVMRGAGCTINDMWDKDIDAKVERTKDRPLVSGKLSQKQALVFLAGQLSIGLSILLQLNWYSVALGASSMVLVVLYPLAKRVTYYPQLVLGLCFNWGALLGWTALHSSLAPACVALYTAGVSWTLFYDTIYAHQDKRDDLIIGIKSTALKFGDSTKLYLGAFATSLVASLTTAGVLCDLDWPYYLLIGAVSTHIARQVATLDMDNPKDCADKFVSNHRVGLLIFLGILLGKWKTWAEYLKKQEVIRNIRTEDTVVPHC